MMEMTGRWICGMENNLIKLFDPLKAKMLADNGFEYMLEDIGGKKAYVFCVSEELLSFSQKCFEKNSFFLDNTLRF